MFMNLTHHLFKTKLDCSAVSLDGYSPQNLLSSNWRERKQGFMAEHFIKTPVYLLFQFAFPIQMHSVVIKPKVGSQISTGFDLFVAGVRTEAIESAIRPRRHKRSSEDASQPEQQQHQQKQQQQQQKNVATRRGKRRHIDLEHSELNLDGKAQEKLTKTGRIQDVPTHNYSTSITTDSFKNDRSSFTLVSRINEQNGRTLRIVNRRYNIAHDRDMMGDVLEYDFFHGNVLGFVSHLVVVINRVKGSCVPSLGKLEIWGKPSTSCGENIIDYASGIQRQINQENEATCHFTENKLVKETVTEDNSDVVNDEDDTIPHDFLDPITCNLMTIPMLLPSGLNIDMTTLEKHSNAERQWGRMPSDPFTGVAFTNSVKPITNSALKVRIDKYILTSGIDVNGYGRTIGRSSNYHKQDARISQNIVDKGSMNNCKPDVNVCIFQSSTVITDSRNQTGLKTEAKHETKDIKEATCSDVGVAKTKDVEMHTKVVKQTHEEQISNSLDDALMKTLHGATFTRKKQAKPATSSISCSSLINDNDAPCNSITEPPTQPRGKTQEPRTCICCKVAIDIAFKLPCQHLLCRKCLLLKCSSSKKAFCSMCKHPFLRKDVIRVHTV